MELFEQQYFTDFYDIYGREMKKNMRTNLNFSLQPMFTTIENRIYREEFTRKKCKTAILLYCFYTAGVLHIFMLYNLLGPGISFYRKSKIIVKRKPNYEIGRFHN